MQYFLYKFCHKNFINKFKLVKLCNKFSFTVRKNAKNIFTILSKSVIMKILSVNTYKPNFNGIRQSRILTPIQEEFERLLSETAMSDDVLSDKYSCDIDSKPIAVTIIPGRDLVPTRSKIVKRPRPFSLSDKQLVLDDYQMAAVEHFRNGENVMVTAPTGTGKTLIAEHVINDILKSGKKVIYTTPLKALCNDKYKQFSALWGDYDSNRDLVGSTRIGLATGDVKINTDAPLVIMTTEIFRNMLIQHGEKDIEKKLKNVGAVIFDEFHYMGDSQRGSVWEEALMFSPPKIRHLMLSATIANASPIINWLNAVNPHHKSVLVNVPEDERHVPLKYMAYSNISGKFTFSDFLDEKINLDYLKTKELSIKERETLSEIGSLFNEKDGIKVLETKFKDIFDNNGSANINSLINKLVVFGVPYYKAVMYGLRLTDKQSRNINPALAKSEPLHQPPLEYLINDLEKKKMTPALYFVYSKRNCKKYMKEASEKIGPLLTKEEQNEVMNKINEVQNKGIFLGTDFTKEIVPCLLNGFAMHHSGMLPQCKSFIEELGRNKLIKVCFATDTLGAGINFPFKTVVFSDFEKYTEDGFEEISVNSFKQGAGRAGRRGIDDVGYVVVVPKDKDEIAIPYRKIVDDADEVKSAFTLSYGLILSPRFLNKPLNILQKSFDNFQRSSYDENLQKSQEMKEILKKRKFIEDNNGTLKLTKKGKIASRIRGINEILMTEILTDKNISENIKPSELAAIISMFAPERNEDYSIFDDKNISDEYTKKLKIAANHAMDIKDMEQERGLDTGIKINSGIPAYIKMWAELPDSYNNKFLWSDMVYNMTSKALIRDEGDLFKKINFSTNILKQIRKAAPTEYLRDTASKAIKMLQKSPVNDILLYELNYKENNE